MLNADTPSKVAEVEQKVRQARSKPKPVEGQIPQFAGFAGADQSSANSASAQGLLCEIALSLVELAKMADALPADAQTTRALESAEQSLTTIRHAVERHRV